MTSSLLTEGAATDALRVLLLEDSAEDAELVVRELRRVLPECQVHRVDTAAAFQTALTKTPQLILSDHRLSGFNGMHALEIARERTPDTPFIFVTGSLDEETAVECVKAGAWDYVLKDRLVRLGPAVHAALELRRTRDALKRSQEALLHTQKMDALGRLAGGVAHDYNNLMTAVIGFCYLIGQSLEDGDPRQRDLAEIRRAAERAAALTEQLLAFSRKQVITLQPVQLNEVIAGTERLLGRLIGERVTFVCRCAERLPPVHSDRGQLEQVIMNLAINARDAMPDGGTLTIETATVVLDDVYRRQQPDSAIGPHVRLTVTDTGVGIDPAAIDHIFEPFYTTKPRGKGTGLGLATVYGVVRQSRGHVTVQSRPGRTSFNVYLPASAGATVAAASRDPRAQRLAGTETVLVVEDDLSILALARRVLGGYGYRVLDAGAAKDALALSAREARIDLVVTDIGLPDLSGPELVERLRAQRGDLRVLYVSGYTDEVAGMDVTALANAPFLQKPFTPIGLAERVRAVLDDAPRSRDAAEPRDGANPYIG